MPRYIDANAYIKYCEEHWIPLNIDVVKKQPTADMVDIIINELTEEISERIIQALEENYEIIPKKPAVSCKNCKWRDESTCLIHGAIWKDDDFCSQGESRTNAKNEEVDLTKMRVNIEKTWVILREAKRRDNG